LRQIETAVGQLRRDIEPLTGAAPTFAVKANRDPRVLRCLAGLGLGADVASAVEVELALDSGFKWLSWTAPVDDPQPISRVIDRGGIAFLDSIDQLERWGCDPRRPRAVGLRLKVLLGSSAAGCFALGSGGVHNHR
jgi:diaminopimelate decarboxylase